MIRTPGLALLNVLKLCTWLDKVLLRPNILLAGRAVLDTSAETIEQSGRLSGIWLLQ